MRPPSSGRVRRAHFGLPLAMVSGSGWAAERRELICGRRADHSRRSRQPAAFLREAVTSRILSVRSAPSFTLVRHWLPERSLASDAGLVLAFSLFFGLVENFAIPLHFLTVTFPVPEFAYLLWGVD